VEGSFNIYPLGNSAIGIELGNTIEFHVSDKVLALCHHIQQQRLSGIKDIIPAYTTLTIVFNAITIRQQHQTSSAFLFLQQWIQNAIITCVPGTVSNSRLVEIPVCYHPSLGIDLEEMAVQKNSSVEEIIRLHSARVYRVYMIGFLPGFPYMGNVHEQIATPRKQQPRARIEKGSVGIAGLQTGIYPADSPGGWNIIGKTPLQMFNANRDETTLLQAGDEVRFVPIDLDTFKNLQH